ncbi:MAG TPA: hypothetical protein VF596_18365 [Pyrinomonadaceae bacterium]|jgi:hypothetical protein
MQSNCLAKFIVCSFILILSLLGNVAFGQMRDTTVKKRLRSPANVKGFVGGESHDSYVIHARKGQRMTIQLSWKREDDNTAEFTVSKGRNFLNAEQVNFGKSSRGGRVWTGKIPRSQDYYIYVVAHPAAHYHLKVRLR